MRRAEVRAHSMRAGELHELPDGRYRFQYDTDYIGPPISLTMSVRVEPYLWDGFPPFFDGLLPEGLMLEALLRALKIDRNDAFAQICAVGGDLVGAVTVEPLE
jgi:serine/threonine-protein kinase HipA